MNRPVHACCCCCRPPSMTQQTPYFHPERKERAESRRSLFCYSTSRRKASVRDASTLGVHSGPATSYTAGWQAGRRPLDGTIQSRSSFRLLLVGHVNCEHTVHPTNLRMTVQATISDKQGMDDQLLLCCALCCAVLCCAVKLFGSLEHSIIQYAMELFLQNDTTMNKHTRILWRYFLLGHHSG